VQCWTLLHRDVPLHRTVHTCGLQVFHGFPWNCSISFSFSFWQDTLRMERVRVPNGPDLKASRLKLTQLCSSLYPAPAPLQRHSAHKLHVPYVLYNNTFTIGVSSSSKSYPVSRLKSTSLCVPVAIFHPYHSLLPRPS
jgi:hypothetical protein